MASPPLETTPPPTTQIRLSYPAPFILLVTIAREKSLNSISYATHHEMGAVFDWYDTEPNLRVAIVTGAGKRAFCAGQDLIELGRLRRGELNMDRSMMRLPTGGFGGLSRRAGKKPVIAAVNGFAFGGGFEIVLGCDMVVASPKATFALPEALRGIFASAGGPPRLVHIVGLPVATEIALTGKPITAQRAYDLRLVNCIAATEQSVVEEAIALANDVAALSPDAAIVTRAALKEALETGSVEEATRRIVERYADRLVSGENAQEGLKAFAEKRKPVWKPSKL